jgi:predicted dehydrogenase
VIRWLLVGTGQAGRCHLEAIARTAEANLAGVVTRDLPPPGVGPVFPALGDAVRAVAPDAVILATPHDTHLALALEALDLGLPVLCEKPVGTRVEDARQILQAATRTGLPVGVVLNQRAALQHRWIHGLIGSGAVQPRSIRFSGAFARLGGWHADPERAGGGLLRVIGLHYLDLMRWWLGEPETVAAVTGGGPAENRADVLLRFAAGAIGSLYLSAVRHRSAGPVRCVIEAPAAKLTLAGHLITHAAGLPEPPAAEPWEPALAYGPGHEAIVAEATAALAQGRALPIPLEDALGSLELLERVYRAARTA